MKKNSKIIAVCLLIGFILMILRLVLTHMELSSSYLHVEMKSSIDDTAKVYYDLGRGLSEKDSQEVKVMGDQRFHVYEFMIPQGVIGPIRFDPLTNEGSVTIKKMEMVAGFGKRLGVVDLRHLRPANQIKKMEMIDGEAMIITDEKAGDPQMYVVLKLPASSGYISSNFFFFIFQMVLEFLLFSCLGFVVACIYFYFRRSAQKKALKKKQDKPPARPHPALRRGWGRQVLLALVATLVASAVTLVVIEIVLRVAGFGSSGAASVPAKYDKFRPDAEAIWGLKSNWEGAEPNNVPVRLNSIGLRGSEPRSKHGPRILFVGDSVTYGHHISYDDAIPARLEAALRPLVGSDVEVLNAGVPGYSTFQEEALFRRLGPQLRPDLVLVGFCLNDVTERYTSLSQYGGDRFFMGNVDTEAHVRGPKALWLRSATRAATIALLKTSARHGELYRVERLWTEPDNPRIRDAWELVFTEMDRLIATAQTGGARIAVVLFPYAPQLTGERTQAPQERLAAHLAAKQVPAIDVLPALASHQSDPAGVFLDFNHFSARGSALVAGYLATQLVATGLVGQRSP